MALVGAVFHGLGGLLVARVDALQFMSLAPQGYFHWALAGAFVAFAVVGASLLFQGRPRQVAYGAAVTLAVALFALPTVWGLFIGSALGFAGGILGWQWVRGPLRVREDTRPQRVAIPDDSEMQKIRSGKRYD